MREASTGSPATIASPRALAPPSIRDEITNKRLFAITPATWEADTSPRHSYRVFDIISLCARAALVSVSAAPRCMTRIRDVFDKSLAAMAARNGSFTDLRCPTTHTSKLLAESRERDRLNCETDWYTTLAFFRQPGRSSTRACG